MCNLLYNGHTWLNGGLMATVLIVDDESDTLDLMSEWLSMRGYDVLPARSGNEALRLADSDHPDLILLDDQMPVLDGIETCRRLRQNPSTRNIPVILITGQDSASGQMDALLAGATDFAARPVTLSDLGMRMRLLLEGNPPPATHTDGLAETVVASANSTLKSSMAWLFVHDRENGVLASSAVATLSGRRDMLPARHQEVAVAMDGGWIGGPAERGTAEINLEFADISVSLDPVYQTCKKLEPAFISLIPLRSQFVQLGLLLLTSDSPLDTLTYEGRRAFASITGQAAAALNVALTASRAPIFPHREIDIDGAGEIPFMPQGDSLLDSMIADMLAYDPSQQDEEIDSDWSEEALDQVELSEISLSPIKEAAREIASALSSGSAFHSLLNEVSRSLGVSLAMLLVRADKDSADLLVHTAVGLRAKRLAGLRLAGEESLQEMVMASRQAQKFPDPQNNPRFDGQIDAIAGVETQSIAAAPIIIGDEVVGVLEVRNKRDGDISKTDLELLDTFSAIAAMIIDQVRLSAEIRRLSDETTSLREALDTNVSGRELLAGEISLVSNALDSTEEIAEGGTEKLEANMSVLKDYARAVTVERDHLYAEIDRLKAESTRPHGVPVRPPYDPITPADLPPANSTDMRLIHRMSAVFAEGSLDELLTHTCRDLMAVLGCQWTDIFQWDRNTQEMVGLLCLANMNRSAEHLKRSLDDVSYLKNTVDNRKAMSITIEQFEPDSPTHARLAGMGMGSALLYPILIDDQVVGLAEMFHAEADRIFSTADQKRCDSTLAAWIQFLPEGAGWRDDSPTLSKLAAALMEASTTDWCVLYALDSEKKTLETLLEWSNRRWEAGKGPRIHPATGSLHALKIHEAKYYSGSIDGGLYGWDRTGLHGLNSGVFSLAPLSVRGSVVGVLRLVSGDAGRTWGADERQLIELAASMMAVALDNSRLYSFLDRRAAQLEAAYTEVRSADRAKNEFIQNVSHELRTPLAAIMGYADLMKTESFGPVTDEQKERLELIETKAQEVAKLVDQVIAVRQVQHEPLNRTMASLESVASLVCGALKPAATKAGITVILDCEQDLPSVFIDRDRIFLAFENLLSNAIKFSKSDTTVTLKIQNIGDSLVVDVIDQGMGIPELELDKIWERFYQVDGSIVRERGGTGIGLAVVKQVVEAHEGKVWVASRPGEGSSFSFSIPKARVTGMGDFVPSFHDSGSFDVASAQDITPAGLPASD
jgi:signal transduction histidine kinase/CheY-like chemotaxis protein